MLLSLLCSCWSSLARIFSCTRAHAHHACCSFLAVWEYQKYIHSTRASGQMHSTSGENCRHNGKNNEKNKKKQKWKKHLNEKKEDSKKKKNFFKKKKKNMKRHSENKAFVSPTCTDQKFVFSHKAIIFFTEASCQSHFRIFPTFRTEGKC